MVPLYRRVLFKLCPLRQVKHTSLLRLAHACMHLGSDLSTPFFPLQKTCQECCHQSDRLNESFPSYALCFPGGRGKSEEVYSNSFFLFFSSGELNEPNQTRAPFSHIARIINRLEQRNDQCASFFVFLRFGETKEKELWVLELGRRLLPHVLVTDPFTCEFSLFCPKTSSENVRTRLIAPT